MTTQADESLRNVLMYTGEIRKLFVCRDERGAYVLISGYRYSVVPGTVADWILV